MPLEKDDLPLKEGWEKVYAVPGNTAMVASYRDGKLSFEKKKGAGNWNRLYPFEITIDPGLTRPKSFRGRLLGFETTPWGSLKKHLDSRCHFSL